jgi:hypothetical protein
MTRKQFVKSFVTPETVDIAFNFGFRSALAGHGRLSREQFFPNGEEAHLFPTSLWRAYSRGFKAGVGRREERAAFATHPR